MFTYSPNVKKIALSLILMTSLWVSPVGAWKLCNSNSEKISKDLAQPTPVSTIEPYETTVTTIEPYGCGLGEGSALVGIALAGAFLSKPDYPLLGGSLAILGLKLLTSSPLGLGDFIALLGIPTLASRGTILGWEFSPTPLFGYALGILGLKTVLETMASLAGYGRNSVRTTETTYYVLPHNLKNQIHRKRLEIALQKDALLGEIVPHPLQQKMRELDRKRDALSDKRDALTEKRSALTDEKDALKEQYKKERQNSKTKPKKGDSF